MTRLLLLPLVFFLPVAVALGFGFKSELLTLALVYGGVWVASRLLMRSQWPRFRRLARGAGFVEPK